MALNLKAFFANYKLRTIKKGTTHDGRKLRAWSPFFVRFSSESDAASPRQTHEINAVRWSQVADRKNSPNRGIRRGRPLTSQTAFGGQLPYKGSLVRPVARFHHILSEYNGRLLRATSICHGIGYSHKSRRYALWASPTVSHTGDKILCGCMPHL